MTGDEYKRQLQQENNRVCTSDYILLHSENRKMWFHRRNTGHIITTIYRRKSMKKQPVAQGCLSGTPSLQPVLTLHTESRQSSWRAKYHKEKKKKKNPFSLDWRTISYCMLLFYCSWLGFLCKSVPYSLLLCAVYETTSQVCTENFSWCRIWQLAC